MAIMNYLCVCVFTFSSVSGNIRRQFSGPPETSFLLLHQQVDDAFFPPHSPRFFLSRTDQSASCVCVCVRDVLPFPLELPEAIAKATSHKELESISHMGIGGSINSLSFTGFTRFRVMVWVPLGRC